MQGFFVLLAGIAFIGFLFAGENKKYLAIAGWTAITLFLIASLPRYAAENNFIYPVITLLSIPFLAITIRQLLSENRIVLQMTRGAAVAFCIYAPFAYIPVLNEWLISLVISQILSLLSALGVPAYLADWNIIQNNGFRVEIILACTGLQSIAIMLGVAGCVTSTWRQKLNAFLIVVPVIYLLNLMRNVFVIIAYTGQWFPYFTEIASNGEYGFESFFWAHNVICELLALVALILIAYGLFLILPQLSAYVDDLITLYAGEIRKIAGKDR